MTELLRSTLLAALLMLAGAGPALAGKGDDDLAVAGFEVTETQALEIARVQAIACMREVKARRGVWNFEGVDADGVVIGIEIDGFTGDVVKVGRYRMPAQDYERSLCAGVMLIMNAYQFALRNRPWPRKFVST